jgi:alpha-L-fucosidase
MKRMLCPGRIGHGFVWAVCMGLVAGAVAQPRYEPRWESLDRRPTPEWFRDAKFGIFIHWGLYSVPGWGVKGQYAEWYWHRMAKKGDNNPWWEYHKRVWGEDFDYAQFAPLFRCEHFDPDEWASFFERSGARYVVPTSKHHDGFCLWPSAEASRTWGRPWNAVDTGPRRDLLGALADAVRKRGLKFGFYYSLYEWFNPLWRSDRARYVNEHMLPQLKDAVLRYRPSLIFSDGEWEMTSGEWRSEEFLAWLFNDSPVGGEVAVNDRWGKETRHKHGGYYTTEYAAGLPGADHPWEENRGMAYSYGWNRMETADDYRSARELILLLCDTVSRGGNLLLNVGPTGDGRIPVIMQQRLLELGEWLRVNGEAIYGTRFAGRAAQWTEGRIPEQKYGDYNVEYKLLEQVGQQPRPDGQAVKQVFFTRKGDTLYAITAGWPGRRLVLRDVEAPSDAEVTMLSVPGRLKANREGRNLVIETPQLGPEEAPCRYAYAFKIRGGRLLPAPAAAR